ncbi:MAG: DNA glycosylase AlkZ-like family protein [Opitutales bacterium]
MSHAPLPLTPDHARRFHRRAVLLDTPVPDIPAALAHLGYVQIDPINVCGRMHDLVLRQRVTGYREGGLHRYLHASDRPGFEHYLPGATAVLAAYPAEAWPYLAGRIRRRRLRGGRYGRKLAPSHERLAGRILAELAARGPLTSDEIEHEGRSRTGWGTPGRLVKNILEIMLVHGRVLITARRNFRRVYDLPERVLPAALLAAPEKDEAETARWLALLRLRQRRLVLLKRTDLSWVADAVQPIQIIGGPLLHCLHEDLPLVDQTARPGPAADSTPLLLAPLDPLIYDRRVTSRLWNYDYIWEAYTPPAKRRRGYYALPVLAGTELVGHIDPKADRPARRLRVMARSIRRGHRVAGAVAGLAHFLGLRAGRAPQ